ncbi:MAG: tRNA (adenosine(37)-N6)-dimethylallyltransferase MiaA [Gammaproteobacteria bacterium]|nr:tRNA (adenosine(37)-N6)-dimethylallyltransferase MiaA [Gammaproteobacteria bacterium]
MDAEPQTRRAHLPAVCLFGPTGTGKTELAMRLAEALPVEIISVDSALVYRRMDVGTAKPTPSQRGAVPHHLIDIRDPWEGYSAGEFRQDALRLIATIRARGRLPLLVGGTLLYFRALQRGLAAMPAADPAVRAQIASEAQQAGWTAMHEQLAEVDPFAAGRIAPGDRQRIERALEVYRLTGQPISALQAEAEAAEGGRFLRIALWPSERAALYERLDRRLQRMLREGFIEEVRVLHALPQMSADRPAIRAVGYRQLWQYLDGDCDLAEAERRAAVATRRLAKRQLTWMRAEESDLRVSVPDTGAPERIVRFLEASGVSRRALRCNMMGAPSECREHGV